MLFIKSSLTPSVPLSRCERGLTPIAYLIQELSPSHFGGGDGERSIESGVYSVAHTIVNYLHLNKKFQI